MFDILPNLLYETVWQVHDAIVSLWKVVSSAVWGWLKRSDPWLHRFLSITVDEKYRDGNGDSSALNPKSISRAQLCPNKIQEIANNDKRDEPLTAPPATGSSPQFRFCVAPLQSLKLPTTVLGDGFNSTVMELYLILIVGYFSRRGNAPHSSNSISVTGMETNHLNRDFSSSPSIEQKLIDYNQEAERFGGSLCSKPQADWVCNVAWAKV
ncbi:hypothetical protein LXL04_016576 [Taraxacum kok-saghyz]